MNNFEDIVRKDKNRFNELLKLLKNEIIIKYNEMEIEDSETLIIIKIKKYNLLLDVTDEYVKVYKKVENDLGLSKLLANKANVTIDGDDIVITDHLIIIRLKDFMITNNNKNLKRMFIVMQI